jgi:acrylyl-CoA reductase (NADPH)
MDQFNALVVEQVEGKTVAGFRTLTQADLPDGDVTVAIEYSSLNYKDGLAVTGRGKVVRKFPMVPGIDFAGTVIHSSNPAYKPGDKVVLTGWGVGETHWGGYAQVARVKADWLVPLSEGMTTRQAMAIGTAGLTAMLCVMALEERPIAPEREVLVTGAAGGVGSVAVALLTRKGLTVAASTGRPELGDYLRSLGATVIVPREELAANTKPLLSERWSGAVDTVGGTTLATVLAAMAHGGTVAACGLAGGADLPTTVMPFILRGVRLIGVDSAYCPPEVRKRAWTRLAAELPADFESRFAEVVSLDQVPRLASEILAGKVRGRIVVDVPA